MSYNKKKVRVYSPEEGYDKHSNEYDKFLAFLDSFEKNYFSRLRYFFENKKVLDAGAGTGRNTLRLYSYGIKEIVALDISQNMLDKLKLKNPRVDTVKGDIRDIPFADGMFDIVIINMVLVHLYDPIEAIDEVYRVLRDKGELYITLLHQKKPVTLCDGKERYKIESYYHSSKKIKRILEDTAFKVIEENEVIEANVKISTIFRCRK